MTLSECAVAALEGRAAERAQIVKWLRNLAARQEEATKNMWACQWFSTEGFANAIERGEHERT